MDILTPNNKDITRFWEKVDKSGDCWIWTSQLRAGYGIFRYKNRVWSAHRFSFALVNQLDDRLQVCHSCDTPACVRPEHLFQGSAKANSDDKLAKDRHNFTLSNEQVVLIRKEPLSNTVVRDVAKKYNIGKSLAKSVLEGTTYRHLPGGRELPRQFKGRLLNEQQVAEIKEALKNPYWGIQTELANKYGVAKAIISHINNGYVDYPDTV